MSTIQSVVIERIVSAELGRVWEAWTDQAAFGAWYGPMGAEISVKKMDVRVDGPRHFCMQMKTSGGLMKMWFVGAYEEVNPMTRLLYTESMSNEAGAVLSPASMGMGEGYPETTRVELVLTSLGERTRMVLTHHGVAADSRGAMGWNMALDKLERFVSS